MEYDFDSNVVTLRLLGFSDPEKARFSSILTLAERGLKKKWTVISHINADFFLIKEHLIAQMDVHEVLKSLPRQRCIFIRHKHDNLDIGGHQIHWGEGEVPSLRMLVEFLNQTGETKSNPANAQSQAVPLSEPQPTTPPSTSSYAQPVPQAAPAAPKQTFSYNQSAAAVSDNQAKPIIIVSAATEFFDPEQGFLGHLLAQANSPRAFKLANQHADLVLYVDSAQNRYYSNVKLEQLKPFCLAGTELQITALMTQQLQTIIAEQALKPHPMSNLLWYATFTSSRGRVIKGYQKGDIVHLKRWPDVNLPGCRQLIRLAAYMQSNAVDLDTVHANTKIPINQIYDFYNACKIIQLIGHSQTKDVHEKELDTEQKQLYARIGRRLGNPS
ncbi:MAG: hypothetical protein NTV43_02120 [Methylococcales bacterium]|nr:hypothetical protein [Methylococcales bacterium]